MCNGILNAATPMSAKILDIRRESNRLSLTAIRLKVYGMLSFQCRVATIASTRTIGGVHDVERYWIDGVADSPHSV
jgi:hypothetical protein